MIPNSNRFSRKWTSQIISLVFAWAFGSVGLYDVNCLNCDSIQTLSCSDSNLIYIMQHIIYLHPDLEFCCELGCGIWYSALCYSPLYLDCSYFSVIIKTLKWIQLICYLSGTSLERLDNNRTQVRTFSLVSLLDKMTINTLSVSCVHGDVINNDSSASPSLSILC